MNNEEKNEIYIGLDDVFGPIFKDYIDEDGNESSGSEIVDNDPIAKSLDKEIFDMWYSLFSKDPNSPTGFRFDIEGEKKLAPILLEKINKLIERLNEINDGSFEIVDMTTEYLKKIISGEYTHEDEY